MKSRKHFYKILISFCFLGNTAAYTEAHSAPLKAGIEHAEKLAPVKLNLRAGQKFDEKTSFTVEDKEWFQIPRWLSGSWRSIQRIRTSQYDSQNGETKNTDQILAELERETFGYQEDRERNIWTLEWSLQPQLNISSMTDTENSKDPKTIKLTTYTFRTNHPLYEDDSRVQVKTLDTLITVRGDNGKIESTELRETYRTIVRLSDQTLAIQADQQTYDEQGFPKLRNQISEIKRREREHKNIDSYQMTNILAAFKIFLRDNRKSNLMPER